MAEIAKLVMVTEAFVLEKVRKVIPKDTIIHFTKEGTEKYEIYSREGEYIGYAYNISYKEIPQY